MNLECSVFYVVNLTSVKMLKTLPSRLVLSCPIRPSRLLFPCPTCSAEKPENCENMKMIPTAHTQHNSGETGGGGGGWGEGS